MSSQQLASSAFSHACGGAGAEVSEPAREAVGVSGIVPQQLVNAREGWTVIDMVHGARRVIHL